MHAEVVSKTVCFHCGENCADHRIHIRDKIFCCQGCKMVYELLNENNLCAYYDLNPNPGLSQQTAIRENKFSYLDDPAIIRQLVHFDNGKETQLTFYLPQIHCSSCLWLLENIHRVNEGIVESKVNFSSKEIFIVFDNSKTSLRKVAESLAAVGYEPHINLQQTNGNIKVTDRSQIYKLGVAGFCFANIMMMSLPEYFSMGGFVENDIRLVLKIIIIILSLPVFFYAAAGFFISAWKGLRHKFLNIDAPIAFAIAITFGRSLYEIFSGTGPGYFDSMSGIVFFMLVGRVLQDKSYNSISFERDYRSFFPIAVNVIKENGEIPTQVRDVKEGDRIRIYSGELIPADCILSKGKAEIDYSFVSGESDPVRKQTGEIIYAGGRQMNGALELLVIKEVSQSYLVNLWNNEVFKKKEAREKPFIHALGKYFTWGVLAIALLAASYWLWQRDYKLMWNTLTTVFIVACPCALLLASTFTNGHLLRIFGQNKLYLRHPDVIENMTRVNHLVFDKTGTMTSRQNSRVVYEGRALTGTEKLHIASLVSHSSHPLSKLIAAYLNETELYPVINFTEYPGKGIEAWMDDTHYKLGSSEFIRAENNVLPNTAVHLRINDEDTGRFIITGNYRKGFEKLAGALKNNFLLSVLSGDNEADKNYLQKVFGDKAELIFHSKPDQKLAYIRHLQQNPGRKVMMIGDGLNDAGALKQSDVGIAITENSNNFTPSCDGILDASRFSQLDQFIAFAKNGKHVIQFTFLVSVIYNVIGLYFAVQGTLSPLIAAILMPCSSVSIVFMTYGLTRFFAWRGGLLKYDSDHTTP